MARVSRRGFAREAGLQGAVIKDEEKDHATWQEYLANVMRKLGVKTRAQLVKTLRDFGDVFD